MNQKPEMRSLAWERWLLGILSMIQFTTVVDFLIMMPLGPQYMRVFSINPTQFGLLVSSYAVSAGISGLFASVLLDRFDRKSALLFLYAGFVIGTLLCALAPGYYFLMGARVIAGAFAGVCGSTILAVVGDVIPEERRGRAMGMVMSSFSVASIAGVPLGLYVANLYGWHAPFWGLGIMSLLVWFGVLGVMPSLKDHFHGGEGLKPLAQIRFMVTHPNYLRSFGVMAAMTSTGFCVFPFMSPYMVSNVGLTEAQLPAIYLCGGSLTLFTMNLIGRMADRYGKLKMFIIMSTCAMIPVFIVTNLNRQPLSLALCVTSLMMICMSGRFVPGMALITSSVERRHRGSFMSLNTSIQQFSSGLSSFIGGAILGQASDGRMTHYPRVGMLSALFAVTSIYLARKIVIVKEVSTLPAME